MTKPERLHSLDLVRGLAMVVMAIDHARDYFGDLRLDPMSLEPLDPALYLTRWITHFCAPIFVMLAGTSAYLYGRERTRGELSRFLFTRGLWLVLLEFTLVKFGWQFSFVYRIWTLQVIAAIGVAMMVLAGLVWLPRAAVLALALIIVGGHNLLDDVEPAALAWPAGFKLLHEGFSAIPLGERHFILVIYPLLPWVGVMALGYALGPVFDLQRSERRRRLVTLGLAACFAFVVLRATGVYGDPRAWEPQSSVATSVALFFDCQKYPPALLFLLMTLGPSLVLLAAVDREPGSLGRKLIVFGRVPLFFYLLHVPLIHATSALLYLVQHGELISPLRTAYEGQFPAWFGNGLPTVYLGWAFAVVVLYFPCRWYEGVKRRSRSTLLSYL